MNTVLHQCESSTSYFVGDLSWRRSQLLSAPKQRLFLLSPSPHCLPPILITLIWTAPQRLPLLSIGLFLSPSLYPPTLYLYSKGSQGSLASVPKVLFKHLPHPVPGPVRDAGRERIKSSACLYCNIYVNVCAYVCSCLCLHVCMCVYAWVCLRVCLDHYLSAG